MNPRHAMWGRNVIFYKQLQFDTFQISCVTQLTMFSIPQPDIDCHEGSEHLSSERAGPPSPAYILVRTIYKT